MTMRNHRVQQESEQKDYETLHGISRHARILAGISSVMEWDQETYMPPASAEIRAEQLKTLAGLIHQVRTSKEFGETLGKLADIKAGGSIKENLTESQKAAVREWRNDYLKERALPNEFVEEFAQLASQSQVVWRQARTSDSFDLFAPFLEKIIRLNRRKADYLGYSDNPYDALLDLYEPGATAKGLRTLFNPLRQKLSMLVKKITAAEQVDDSFLHGNFDPAKQLAFSHQLLKLIGYDLNKGRLDLSAHPFSSASHPSDSRLTTRLHASSVINNIKSVLHEAGHGMYEIGLPSEHYGSPLGEFLSLGIHESQSRWWETRIGQNKAFWVYFLPLLKDVFWKELSSIDVEAFYRGINKVERSFIRVEADEVTYSLHVILRFEIEEALINGTLSVQDIPEVWNQKMHELLGIIPKNNAEGCLQDVHWSIGFFGYFPSYTLGNLYAAQLFEAFEKNYPTWEQKISQGDFLFINQWLHDNIHRHGRRYRSNELLENITDKPLSADPYLRYLTEKYSKIYQISPL